MASIKLGGTVSKVKLGPFLPWLMIDRPLFLTKNGRWRMAQVLMISIFGQFSGNGLGACMSLISAAVADARILQRGHLQEPWC